MKLVSKIFGDTNAREARRLKPLVQKINSLEPELEALSDSQLKEEAAKIRERLGGKDATAQLPRTYALVREAARRTIDQRHYDAQLMGGIVLHEGKIAEMRTGEGKTLVATLPVSLNALSGKGVHVVTVNDYLARRDAGWMGRVYAALGLTTAVIMHEQSFMYDPDFQTEDADDERLSHLRPISRQEAYRADITYGTNNEFGFDYLRDNMVEDVAQLRQRPLNFAIVDEVDSILIDEARTPLIISAPAEESTDKYYQFAALAAKLVRDQDYSVDEKMRAVSLTDEGINRIEKALGVENVYEAGRIEDVHHIEQALKAEALFARDRDYVVREDEVIIVDEFTGRLMQGRRYSEGLHQAIEAKEKVQIRQESITLATITFQNYFRMYKKLAGMTGTAATEAEEFGKIYSLDVVTIPTHRPMIRQDLPDRIYKTGEGKFRAVAREVQERHAKGQPVLIGTVSIEKNEQLSALLHQLKLPHEILNAKNNLAEAAIVAKAGERAAVTLATNIAGRGTDIVLGEGVSELGGLHVIGTERHEARRIDNQLRGRSGRQGDPGSTQFYVSLDDDLMRIFGSERIAGLMSTLGLDEDTPIENKMVSRSLESAQKKVEGHNFDIRKNLVEYDDVMNRHREVIYARRKQALESTALKPEIEAMIERELQALVQAHTDVRTTELDTEKALQAAEAIFPLDVTTKQELNSSHSSEAAEILSRRAKAVYAEREAEFGDAMRLIERFTYLKVLDELWIEHLEAMDGLREGIGLRAIGQRDPLVEYKNEGYRLFRNLLAAMEGEIATLIFRASISRVDQAAPVETALTRAAKEATGNLEEAGPRQPIQTDDKIGRNDPCPCGSGLKYKKCGLINAPQHRNNPVQA